MDSLIHDLHANNGVIRHEQRGEDRYEVEVPGEPSAPATFLAGHGSGQSRKRPASPVSIVEAVASLQNRTQKRRQTGRMRPTALNKLNTPSPSKKNTRNSQTSTPAGPVHDSPTSAILPRTARPLHQQVSQLQNSTPLLSPQERVHPSSQQETPLTLSPQLLAQRVDDEDGDTVMVTSGSPRSPAPAAEADGDVASDADPTRDPAEEPMSPTYDHMPPLNAAQLNTAAQPLSLPSPSLSPVTAALQHGNSGYFAPLETHQEVPSPLYLQDDEDEDMEIPQLVRTPKRGVSQLDLSMVSQNSRTPSLMDIPDMLDSFDAMPQAVKKYVMYQFLRRCSKNTLQTVASVVNPALKCDFLTLLPVELALEVIGNLDVQSLCAAAQVSRQWRQLIDGDEWTWKKLFDADGYQLQEGELDRAVREGWGYQDPVGDGDWEMDINTNIEMQRPTSSPYRGKRKQTRAHTKQQRKKRETVETLGKDEFNEVMSEIISNTAGPIAAAEAAEKAGLRSAVGLTSLRNLHLFKSIYRRHHIIRRSWIQPDVKPRHISFRGHSEQDRHVVTCLQFDTDKILTGSDDTNINVYDTNTGALRNTLEGHEGGVWALQYEGNTLVSGSTDRTVRVWDIAKGECTQIFHGHTSTVRCLQILMPTKIGTTHDGKDLIMPKKPLIITGSRDSTLRVWYLPMPGDEHAAANGDSGTNYLDPNHNPYYCKTLTGHQHSVRAISAHGDTLVSGSYDHSVKVWRISTGENTHSLRGHTQKVYSVVLDHKRNRCISGSMDNLVKVWSLDAGTVLYTLEGHTQLVGLLDLSHDKLVSAAADSTLRIWDPETGQCKHTLTAHTGAITCFQHDAHKVISGSEQTLKMWNVKTGEFIRNLLTDLTGVWQVRFNERRCVAAVQRENVTYIEVCIQSFRLLGFN